MPGPTEAQILQTLLNALDKDSKHERMYSFQRRFILITLIVSSLLAITCYKYCLINTALLMCISIVVGAAIVGTFIAFRTNYDINFLLPYLNREAIATRLEELKVKIPQGNEKWPDS